MRRNLCASCLRLWDSTSISIVSRSIGLQNSDRIQRRSKGYIAASGGQARPIDGFYAELLSRPSKAVEAPAQPFSAAPPPESIPNPEKNDLRQRAQQVFGTRHVEPEERKAKIEASSQNVAGVMVPPRPTEPDNCCMSGCVNCVWDMYRDDMEEWAAKSKEARAALQAQRDGGTGTGMMVSGQSTPSHVSISMDDDGGGSESNWSTSADQDSLFDDIPVGIREFMKTEKKLKQRHSEEQAVNG